jgi:ATPase subunit of ABC transporter with duplicated ATPase domains
MISDEYARILWQRARNAVEYDRQHQDYLKQQEEWHRQMEQKEKQDRERKEKEAQERAEYRKNLPRQQLDMILSGRRKIWGCCGHRKEAVVNGHSLLCKITRVESLEPGLSLLTEELDAGKIIRLDEKTRNKLVEFAKPDETYPDLINRLLDVADAAATAPRQQH